MINAWAESVKGAYKARVVRDWLFDSVGRLESEMAGWLVVWWNERRLHPGLGYRSAQGGG